MSFVIPVALQIHFFSKNKNDAGYMQEPNRTLLGVYAIIEFTSFYVLLFGLTEKSEGGWGYNYRDELSTFISHRVPEAIFFFRNLVMTTMV